jgi:hypothetical protein
VGQVIGTLILIQKLVLNPPYLYQNYIHIKLIWLPKLFFSKISYQFIFLIKPRKLIYQFKCHWFKLVWKLMVQELIGIELCSEHMVWLTVVNDVEILPKGR